MFNDSIALAVVAAARKNGITPAALLAIVEIETGGKPFETDGRTPAFLFERHICWREAEKRSRGLLAAFRRAGLAIPRWNRATQYRDERTSSQRMVLIRRARAIDSEVSNRSASWGIGQTMGFLAEELGYSNATAMVAAMTGDVEAQIDCMVRFLRRRDVIKSLNAQDWRRVARTYNGAGYAKNRYDVRLRDAYARWSRKLPQIGTPDQPRPTPPEQKLAKDEVRTIQQWLRDHGYHEVGTVDGDWGSRTTAAISAMQAHEGIEVTGQYDDKTRAIIEGDRALDRPVSDDRANATVDDLRDAGSNTIAHADALGSVASVKKWAGGFLLAGGSASQVGLLDQASGALDKVDQAKTVWSRVSEMFGHWLGNPLVIALGLFLLVAGFVIARRVEAIRQNRLKDHQTGEHAGPTQGGDE
jgi:hypothetical protein